MLSLAGPEKNEIYRRCSQQPTIPLALGMESSTSNTRKARPKAGLIHHTDQGRQYAAGSYRQQLSEHGIEIRVSV